MTQRFVIKTFRTNGATGKVYPHVVGTAYVSQKGVINMSFDSLPLPDKDGRVSAILQEIEEQNNGSTKASEA